MFYYLHKCATHEMLKKIDANLLARSFFQINLSPYVYYIVQI